MIKPYPFLFAIALLSSLYLTAQSNSTKRADKQFSKFQFVKAAESYNKLVEKGNADPYVYKQLADCYYYIFNTVEAEKWYAKALETSQDPEVIFKYSEMLKANGKYDASNIQMQRFARMRPSDIRAMAFNKNPNYLPKLLDQEKKFNIQEAGFNSEQSDFGATLLGDDLYFVSGRNSKRKSYSWNQEPFLDIYKATKLSDGTYQTPELLSDAINTKYHEGLVAFTPDGQTMYFTRQAFKDKGFEKDSITKVEDYKMYLYKATKSSSGWANAEPLSRLNSKNYIVKNPAISADGKTLYFSSNMPGGYGNYDIYSAPIRDDGSVGDPKNMGQKVNTEAQEMFPFISSDNVLYFSSNGHLGLGGMDVYYTKLIDGKTSTVRNIGVPINSNADDFAFSINVDTEEGFVSSNRQGGMGSDDVYQFKKLEPICDVVVTAEVLSEKTQQPLESVMIKLLDNEGNSIGTKFTNTAGKADFIVECDKDVTLEVIKDDFESQKLPIEGTTEEEFTQQVFLAPIEKIIEPELIVLNPIFFEFDKFNITAEGAFELDKLVQVLQKYPNMVVKVIAHTDSRGPKSYNQRLSEKRAKTTAQYVISKGVEASRILAEGKGETAPKVDCKNACTDPEHQQNRQSEFVIVSRGME